VLRVTVNSPRALLLDVIVKTADPPDATVADPGVMFRLLGPEALTVPLPPATRTVTVSEPPSLRIEIKGGDTDGVQITGVGLGVGVAVGVGVGVGVADGVGVGVAVGVGVGVADGVGVGVAVGVGVGVADGDGEGEGVGVDEESGFGWSGITSLSPETFVFSVTGGIESS
jgi:hypothetical protein